MLGADYMRESERNRFNRAARRFEKNGDPVDR